ncbi:hypothetical protein [Nitrosomonas communis]|uniref:Uncharacterized protein n=1 Tax=Nitrosomonas communis TaxID=44574 RepID=A0A1I4VTX8_9PROT|nr:hypothetical protein [Nitrosomonas communis]SFN04467.1 hypothetical protein SAMN05421863_10907 [Nitrosomonas communis]
MEDKQKHGGARKSAGLKLEGKIAVTYQLAPDVVEFLRNDGKRASQRRAVGRNKTRQIGRFE